MQSIITLENLSRSYNIYGENGEVTSKAEALKDVKFEITEGSFTAILGANGSGKSTLAKIFSAILKPSKGTVSVAGLVVGSDLQNKDEQNSVNDDIIYEIRKNAGMVFQNPDNQLIASVVEEDIAFGLENLGIERGEMRRRIDDVMKTVGIYELRKRAPHHLSGGQKQRVAIAGILAMQPKILILDEPTAMLDPTGRAEVMKTAIALNKEKGITIVLITHYMEEAALADRIIVMNKGEVALDGTPKEVFRQEKLVKLYGLDVPQVTEFTHALIEKNDKFSQIPDDIISEDECVELLRKNKILVGASVLEDNIIKHKESRKSENILQTEKLVYKYGRGTPDETMALKEISLSIEKGEFIGIIGHTGSGKSTLIQTFNGLLKPHGGKILVGGRDIWGKVDKKDKKNNSIREIRFKVGLIFQYSEHQLFGETVAKDIAYGPTNMGLLESEVRERVKKAAELVGLDSELMKRSPFDLSGGQQRRVALAGVLAMEPEVLVLDEPAAGLDPLGRENMLDIIKKYHTDGHTVILVSHSMEDIVRYAEKTLVMRGGDIFMFDKTENVFARSDELSDVGLNLPQITRVFEKLGIKGVYTVERAVDLIQC